MCGAGAGGGERVGEVHLFMLVVEVLLYDLIYQNLMNYGSIV